jgi:sortase A
MMRHLIIAALLGAAFWQLGQGGLIQAKAWLGQLLLERAWAETTEVGQAVRPWPGAVSHPVARLRVPELAIDRLVLHGAEPPILAWGPGLESGPHGHRLIAAHRDTHFRFLEQVEPGHRMHLEMIDGTTEHWQVISRNVVDSRTTMIDMGLEAEQLTLVTCYPFDATHPGGPLRLVLALSPVTPLSLKP